MYVGDNIDVMSAMDRDQFHAVVSDPPYGLEFMGKDWDAPWKSKPDGFDKRTKQQRDDAARSAGHKNAGAYGNLMDRGPSSYKCDSALFQSWFLERAVEILRVAKPGAHLLSFGGTRMWHRMACAVEDAGWEIRDTVMWCYGSGFPKGHDISKGIDKMFGVNREVVGKRTGPNMSRPSSSENIDGGHAFKEEYNMTTPATDAAKQWSGWNTALKPALEPVVMARKPFTGSVARNTLDHGCGGINVDGCRVGTTGTDVEKFVATKTSAGSGVYGFNKGEAGEQTMSGDFTKTQKDRRWPANLVLSHHPECVAVGNTIEKSASQSTFTSSGGVKSTFGLSETTVKNREGQTWPGHPDREVDMYKCHMDCPVGMLGDAARFFYTAKADYSDRPHGKDSTVHPTVKPLDLMRYLVRLVCPRGGTVLDPFMGSGSTGCAAIEEGMSFVGIEQSVEYADISVGRLRLSLNKYPTAVKSDADQGVDTKKVAPPTPRRLR